MKFLSKRLFILVGLAVILFGGIFGFKAFVSGIIAEVFDNMEPDPVTISTATAVADIWTPRRETIGTFRELQGAKLSLQADGVVREILFENGAEVEKGTTLLVLDIESDEAELERLRAGLKLTELELERQQRLFDQESISQSTLDRARSEFDQARAAVRAQQARIDQKILRAPFSGVLGIRRVNVGEYLSVGTPVVSLQALDPIFLDFTLPQRFLEQIRAGGTVQARPETFGKDSFEGIITAIEPGIDISSRSVSVQATFPNPEYRFRPGMFARVSLETGDPAEVVTIPQTAIRFSTYGNSVFVVEREKKDDEGNHVAENGDRNGEDHLLEGQEENYGEEGGEKPGERLWVVQRFIQTGERRGDLIAVTEGLEPGEEVASSGLLKLRNQAVIKINNDEAVRPSEDPDPRPDNG